MNNNNNFANEFITKLYGKLDQKELEIILNELYVFSSNYDIKEKSTDITLYNDFIPQFYNTFFVSKQINGIKTSTLEIYNNCLKDFFAYVNKPIQNIATDDIRKYLYYLENVKKISKRTLDQRRLIINSFFEWSTNEEYIPINPCKKITRIKFEEKSRVPLTDIEMEKIRYACKNLRDKTLLEFLYSTGCRVQEVVNLNINDLDLKKKEVVVFGKGSQYRTVYLNARVLVLLEKYLSSRYDDNPALFVSLRKPHQRIKKGCIEKIIKTIGMDSEIGRNIFPHLIRHTTATNALNRGMDVTEVKEMLGHKKIETTMIYAKISNVNLKQHHEKFIV